ncbi:MAG: hypothetical protein JWO28_305 [Hyphomicrobiales bacterium]|nr:hypothetical protein [Hyphomicrobiales bacterium]
MKTITLLAVMAVLLNDIFATSSSVGNPLAEVLILLIAVLAMGLYEAWPKKRDVPGWIVNVVGSIIGGYLAALVVHVAVLMMLSLPHFEGRFSISPDTLRYTVSAVETTLTVLGAWSTLQIVNLFRDRRSYA